MRPFSVCNEALWETPCFHSHSLCFLFQVASFGATCQQYFSLLRNLLKDKQASLDDNAACTLLHELVQQIFQCPVNEVTFKNRGIVASKKKLTNYFNVREALS